MCNYLNHFSTSSIEKISIKNKSFLEDLSKGFNLKNYYTKKGENNIEGAYDDLVLKNKKIDDIFFKNVKKGFMIKIKIFFKKRKSCLI